MKDFSSLNLKGTRTENCLKAALQGEALARNKYMFYEEKAREEGHEHIAEVYERMSRNESYHCKIWFQYLNGGIPATQQNLQDSTQGEMSEAQSMYPEFARIAREEGFDEIADLFDMVGEIERGHATEFLQAMATLTQKPQPKPENDTPKVQYRCQFCGATYDTRPDVCKVCEAIGSFESITE